MGYDSEQRNLTKSINENRKAVQDIVQEYENQKAIIEENMNQSLAQVKHTEVLIEELDGLVDANGKVKDGYEDRVNFILTELNEAYGTELSITNGVINKYKEFKKSIYDVIEAKKAQIVLEANEQLYNEALAKKDELYKEQVKALQNLNKEHELYDEKIASNKTKMAELDEQMKKTTDPTKLRTLGTQWDTLNKQTNLYESHIKNAQIAADEATNAYEENAKRIIKYDQLQVAIISEDTEKIQTAMGDLRKAYSETGDKSELTWKQQLEQGNQYSNLILQCYKDAGKNITEETQKTANAELSITAKSLTNTLNKTKELTPDIVEAYRYLGEQNYELYKKELEKIDPTLRKELQDQIGIVIEKTPEVEKATKELSKTVVNSLDNSSEVRKKATETVKEYIQGLSEKQQRKLLKDCGVKNADKVVEGLKKGDLSEDVGINVIKGLNRGLKNGNWQGITLNTAFNFATKVLNKFKSTFDEHSPSKKTQQFGIYLLQGLGIGIDKESQSVLNTITEFSKDVLDKFKMPIDHISNGMKINQQDFKIDTNQFIDYGQISGAIATQSNINVSSDIEGRIENAIYRGLSNATIPIEIEATTDEGVIFKKVQTKAKEFYTQTGEPAFDF